MIRTTRMIALACILFTGALGQGMKPDSASSILHKAVSEAQNHNKHVVVLFHATWCKWCKRLESVLDTSIVKAIIDEHFVIAHVDVLERGEKQQTHENPGGRELLTDFHGTDAGLPFYAFLDASGKMIGNSNVMPNDQNIGYPGSKEEIAAFIGLLKKSAPRLTAKQCQIISDVLKKKAPH